MEVFKISTSPNSLAELSKRTLPEVAIEIILEYAKFELEMKRLLMFKLVRAMVSVQLKITLSAIESCSMV